MPPQDLILMTQIGMSVIHTHEHIGKCVTLKTAYSYEKFISITTTPLEMEKFAPLLEILDVTPDLFYFFKQVLKLPVID